MEEKPSSANFVLDGKTSSQEDATSTSKLPTLSTLKAAGGE